MANPIICCDFDGVIHSYNSGWQGAAVINDPPVEGAIEWLIKHLPDPLNPEEYKGPIVQIYSSRSKDPDGVKAMKEYLIANGLPEVYIKENLLEFPTQKPPAFLTIDDRAICFKGVFPLTEEMMAFKPWNK